LAFGTLYAEAQRRYLESVAPYARRLFHQMGIAEVDSIDGLPPAIALQQQRGSPTTRSSVGSVTTLSNLLRMLYSRAGDYPPGQPLLYAESFSVNTPEGACPVCQGLGRIYDATEASMVPDPTLSIRDRAIAAWPPAWHGQNLRDILVSLGYDVDRPWQKLPRKTRNWILFTDEQPTVPVYAGYDPEETRRALKRGEEPSYMGTFTSARRYLLHAFATTESATIRKRVSRYLVGRDCPECKGKRLRREALSVTFAGLDIADLSRLPLDRLARLLGNYREGGEGAAAAPQDHPEKVVIIERLSSEALARIAVLQDLGLGYLSLDRSTPTLSPGELQRLRLGTQVHSNLFGVVYVLDEPSAGLHPADTQALLRSLDRLRKAGNSLFVVEHEIDVMRKADWIVDIGPGAGQQGGMVLYSGPPEGLAGVEVSSTARYLFGSMPVPSHAPRQPSGWLRLRGVRRHNIHDLDADIPLGVLTTVTGVSGSGKSTLISQVLSELVVGALAHDAPLDEEPSIDPVLTSGPTLGTIVAGMEQVRRFVRVDQKPIGRTPRSNLATYTGLFDDVRALFAATRAARARKFGAGRFSFNVGKGRCERCEGEGFVMVELLFLPSVYSPCPVCHGARYNPETLNVRYRGKNIADVLALTVDEAADFFEEDESVMRSLTVLRAVGLRYLRLGQPATELSGGEAQRIKLATELQRRARGATLYVLDEPTTGLHPADVDLLISQLQGLVDAGHSVVLVEHDMRVAAQSDWIIDMGPGAGEDGGRIVAAGPTDDVARMAQGATAPFLRKALGEIERSGVAR
jgi:excinuclease ABC subunit A